MLGSVLFRIFTCYFNCKRTQIYTLKILLPILSVKKNEVVEPKLQISAGDFNTWCIDNNMGVHYGKTRTFTVGPKHMTFANEGISVIINEHNKSY